MIQYQPHHRAVVSNILTESFHDNISSNYVLKRPNPKYLSRLMNYSIKKCELDGYIFLNDAETACCLLVDPEKQSGIKSLVNDLNFVTAVSGIGNLNKVLRREKLIKQRHVAIGSSYLHLWYIGVRLDHQGKGIGSKLLEEVDQNFPSHQLILETSNPRNLKFYQRNGFEQYDKVWVENHELYFFKS